MRLKLATFETAMFLVSLLFLLLSTPTKTFAQDYNWELVNINPRLTSIETTPWGILLSENDGRLWLPPYNGIYISENLGAGWEDYPQAPYVGLRNRGVTDLAYKDEKILATTYYHHNNENGLFLSSDGGKTWEQRGPIVSTKNLLALEFSIIMGTYSHGLWISGDLGETWEQKIGTGYLGPEITSITTKDKSIYVSTPQKNYISIDEGINWAETEEEIPPKSITFRQRKYFSAFNNQTGKQDIFYQDLPEQDPPQGTISTNLPLKYSGSKIMDFAWVYGEPAYLYAVVPDEGVYKTQIESPAKAELPIFQIPFSYEHKNELIEKTSSFFDHEYPLLGTGLSEGSENYSTTLNFLGLREVEPSLYYSSHDGVDFALPYDTPVLAALEGIAYYEWDPGGLGHCIKINHLNGFLTIYGHLQPHGLITTSEAIWVSKGTQIGLVGSTGNSTGPHIHFAVRFDKNLDNKFEDNYADGRIDPFGWQSYDLFDPWPFFELPQGRSGTQSLYLWEEKPTNLIYYFEKAPVELIHRNKKLIIEANSSDQNFTVFMRDYKTPKFPPSQSHLTFVTGTSMLVNLYNNLGLQLPDFLQPVQIEIDFSSANLDNILSNTLYIYYWNEETQLWEKIPSVIDLVNRVAVGETTHFSHFALLGEAASSAFIDRAKVVGSVFSVSE